MKPLEQTQREFFAALQMPLRGLSRESTELPPSDEGHSPEFLTKAEELLKSGSNLSSAERLELYHRQYWFRVLDSLAEDFPVLRKMAGEEAFWSLLEAYLTSCPSSSFTLRHLGSRMSSFTGEWKRLDEISRRWFSAIALIEYARMEIYEAQEWKPVAPEDLASISLGLQPHVRLLALPVPADLCEKWSEFSPAREEPVHLAVWRGADGRSIQCRLDAIEFVLLGRLKKGGDLTSIFTEPTEREPSPDEISGWFASWQSRGWIAVPSAPDTEDCPVVQPRDVGEIDWNRIDKMGSQARAMED